MSIGCRPWQLTPTTDNWQTPELMELAVIIALTLTSIVAVTFIVERGIALRWRRNVPQEVGAAVENYNSATDLPILRQVCHQHPSALSRLLLVCAEHLHWPWEEN